MYENKNLTTESKVSYNIGTNYLNYKNDKEGNKMAVPKKIEVRGGRVHNLKNINVDIPLHKFVAISGLSGSGKSSLAMGILYEEGSRRYLDALSTYMRRRIKQGAQADVTSVKHIPSALALRQRPSVPNERATVGTTTETYNVLRLIFFKIRFTRLS